MPFLYLSYMEDKEEKKIINPDQPATGQCAKDSDCGIGEVCVNGKCVQDITPPPPGLK